MATYDINAQLTLLEIARRQDPKGDPFIIAEMLDQTNPQLQDIPSMEANGTTFHRVNRRTSIPEPEERDYNAGVGTGASTTETVDEGMCKLAKYSEVDVDLIALSKNIPMARMQESRPIIEGFGQRVAKLLFNRTTTVNFGSTAVSRKRINGFPERLNTLQANGLVADAGGTGADTTSVYLIQWGKGKIHLCYPAGSQQGITHEDKGIVTASRATTASPETSQLEVYRDYYKLDFGIVVQDPRCMARMANIETTGTNNLFDVNLLIDLLTSMPNDGEGAVMYCNQRVRAQLWKMMLAKSNFQLGYDDLFGTKAKVFNILGVPIRRCDQIGITETAIS